MTESRRVCPNCEQWQNNEFKREDGSTWYDCYNECARRGFAYPGECETGPELYAAKMANDLDGLGFGVYTFDEEGGPHPFKGSATPPGEKER